jgi:outer membrane immunogenic protein
LQQTPRLGFHKLAVELREEILAVKLRVEFMKKFLLACTALGALIGPSAGSDMLPPRDRVPAYGWNGWYAGVNAGVMFNAVDVGTASTNTFAFAGGGGPQLATAVSSLASFDAPINTNGFMGGGQVGYDWQFPWLATALVAGVEADIQGMAAKASSSVGSAIGVAGSPNTLNQSASVSTSLDYLGTLRGRLGMLVGFLGTTVLYYATGGLAYGGASASTTVSQTLGGPSALTPATWTGSGAFSGMRFGWAAGLGAEWLFLPNWSTSLEYLHYDLGSATYGVSTLVTNTAVIRPFTVNAVQTNVPFNGEIIRAGVNYHF